MEKKKKKKETKPRHSLARRRKVNHLPSVRTNKSLGYKVRTIDSGFRSRILYRHEQKLFEFFMVWATRNWRLLDRVIRINSFGFCQIHRSLERVLSEQIMILFSLFSLSIVSKFENDREYGSRIGLNSNATLCTVNHEYHWSTGSGTACFKAIAGKSARENLGYRPSGSFLPSYLRSIDYPRLGDQPIPAFSWHTTSLHFVRSMLLVHRTFALWNVLQIRSNSSPLFSFFSSFFLSFVW